jgi:hypothetical protein
MKGVPGKAQLVVTGAAIGLGVRLARSRHRRSLHPAGSSFTGELEVWGAGPPIGSALVDRPGRYPVTVRLSKGIGTDGGRPDVLGVAVRVPGPGGTTDLLLSTAGRGRLTRHLPTPRRTFDTWYGSITAYRTGTDRKVYLGAGPDPGEEPLGRTLTSVAAAAGRGTGMLLHVRTGEMFRPWARLSFGRVLSPSADDALAFNPVLNSPPDLRPIGLIHGSRALAYRLSQRWRHVDGPGVTSAARPAPRHGRG